MDVGAPLHVFAADVKDIENYCSAIVAIYAIVQWHPTYSDTS